MNTTPESFEETVSKLIASEKFNELFTGGCCFHFALRASLRGIGELWGIESAYSTCEHKEIGHVFVIMPSGDAFDHEGCRSIEKIKIDFYRYLVPDRPVSEAFVKEKIEDQKLPAKLREDIFSIADQRIDKLLGSTI